MLTCSAAHAAKEDDDASELFSVHAQATYVEQETAGFRSPYSGPNSLSSNSGRETTDATLFLGARLGSNAEFWADPEMDQGFGLDDTLGVAGFPSAEAYKVGANQPYFRLQRVFVRDTINLAGDTETVTAAANQFAMLRTQDRLVLTLGKLSVVDIFDTNQYAHDPRGDFLNWSVVDTGSFDYAADSWGYTVGAAAEWYVGSWALRAGVFDLSNVPNSPDLEPAFHEFQMDWEIERRYDINDRQGRVMLTAFDSRGRMGLLDEALAVSEATDARVNIAAVRAYRTRLGVSLDLEQALSGDLGMFVRMGKAAGNVEPYEFTDIDRTVATGVSMKGSLWRRPQDTAGLAGVLNGISGAREAYLNAGGLGMLVGDGKLPHPGPEKIIETYYEVGVLSWLRVTFDYQHITNPGYNSDRGPVPIGAVRVHVQW